MIHSQPHPCAGQTVTLSEDARKHFQFGELAGRQVTVEDWWDRVAGISWMNANGNPACMVYAIRSATATPPLPIDDNVVYGKLEGLGVLLHVSELAS